MFTGNTPFRAFLCAAFLMIAVAQPAISSCRAPAFTAAQRSVIPANKPNQALFNDALIRALSRHRCRAGRRDYGTTSKLVKAAKMQSKNMAKLRKMSHSLPISGQRKLRDRVNRVGIKWRYIAENIALLPRYQFIIDTPFRIVDRSSCKFAFSSNGQQISQHTYASLAQLAAVQWMASPGHRKNILNRKSKRMGAAIAFDAKAPDCGRFYVAQVFSD